MAFTRPLDYIDVAARLMDMREKFPDLTMQQVKMEFVQIAGKDWVVYTAAAYRTPEDQRPGIGTAALWWLSGQARRTASPQRKR